MKLKTAQRLIVKFILNSISGTELEKLDELLQNPVNKNQFTDFVKLNYAIDSRMKKYDMEGSKKLLLDQIKKDKQRSGKGRILSLYKYAAVAVLFLTLGYFLREQVFFHDSVDQIIVPGEDFVTLELGDGSIKVISEDESMVLEDSAGKVLGKHVGGKITYGKQDHIDEIVFNTLKVPYGKKFQLELSDGTIVHLNAGSSFRYPTKFKNGENREVYLTGEAFLEVAEDKENPFVVNSGELNIKVLGTEFNVSAYPEEEVKEVVLVKGSVELYDKKHGEDKRGAIVLSPGMKGNYSGKQGNITTESVVTSIYTSWLDGDLVFRNMTFDKILKKLERQYYVTIVNENTELGKKEFNASFGNMPVEKILEYFKTMYGIQYTINQNEIIIK
ncbi:DUF4974 domain-containing protein [Flagellimonas olearia]|uniref:DUF4974 domain-containing protein n=1 Tax=Flagellimonas olearia TaxID=552546 RepID=A0A6I1E510_9FLAO|nr:FecR family protein [Allomuricauda olearia]KAB7531509.1 DUF4974 domain-containing protein [Allomuricauda olearia]